MYLDHRDKYAADKPHTAEFVKDWAGEVATKRTATGYVMEIRFSLPNVTLKPGIPSWGWTFGVNDDDGQGRKSIMIWPATKTDFWLTMDEYGKFRLSERTVSR